MAVTQYIEEYDTVPEAIAASLQWAFDNWQNVLITGYLIDGPTITSISGMWAILWTITGTDFEVENYHVATLHPPDTLYPVKELLSAPGIATAITWNTGTGVTPSALKDYWRTVVIDGKISAITDATGYVALSIDEDFGVDGTGKIETSVVVIKVETTVFPLYTSDTLRQKDEPFSTQPFVLTIVPGTEPETVIQGGVTSLDALVDAVNAISDQDVEASFNQGQTAYSIKAKVTAGP